MKKADRCCIDCTYFDKDGKECHKFPPRLYIKTAGEYGPETVTLWPSVVRTAWCGAFEAEESVLKDGLNYLKSFGKKDK